MNVKKSNTEQSYKWPRGWEEHKRDQIQFWAENTTPEQRLAWLDEVVLLFAPQIIEYKRRRFESEMGQW